MAADGGTGAAGTPDLSLGQLKAFLAVAEAGSFAGAGRRLGLSTSAVSKMLARFEAAHGVRLLHRSTHALSLTAEGRELVQAARDAVARLEEIGAALTRGGPAGGTGGWVRIGAPVAFQRRCVVPLLGRLREELPGVRLDLRASNDLVDLAAQGIDVALRSGPLDATPGLVRRRWFDFPWILCAAPAYLARRGTPERPADLAGHDLLGFRGTADGLVRPWRLRDPGTGADLRVSPDAPLVFDDGASGWRATLDGLGISSAPMFLAAEAIARGRVVEVMRAWRPPDTPMSIVRRDLRLAPPRVEAVVAFLLRNRPRLDGG